MRLTLLLLLLLPFIGIGQETYFKCSASQEREVSRADSGGSWKLGNSTSGEFKIRFQEIDKQHAEGSLKIGKQKFRLLEKTGDTSEFMERHVLYRGTGKDDEQIALIVVIKSEKLMYVT